jgi:hypothetical protein
MYRPGCPGADHDAVSIADLDSAAGTGARIDRVAPDNVVTGSTWESPPAPSLMTGNEGIDGTGATLRDLWAWSMSDLRANTVRSSLAEFLVARAVSADHRPPVEWDSYDVLTSDGDRVEVKCGASGLSASSRRASRWCQDGGQTAAFTVVRGGLPMTIQDSDLRKRTMADIRECPQAPLAVSGLGVRAGAPSKKTLHEFARSRRAPMRVMASRPGR